MARKAKLPKKRSARRTNTGISKAAKRRNAVLKYTSEFPPRQEFEASELAEVARKAVRGTDVQTARVSIVRMCGDHGLLARVVKGVYRTTPAGRKAAKALVA